MVLRNLGAVIVLGALGVQLRPRAALQYSTARVNWSAKFAPGSTAVTWAAMSSIGSVAWPEPAPTSSTFEPGPSPPRS